MVCGLHGRHRRITAPWRGVMNMDGGGCAGGYQERFYDHHVEQEQPMKPVQPRIRELDRAW
jgi:hypothetical protein